MTNNEPMFKTQKQPTQKITITAERANPDPLTHDHYTINITVLVDTEEAAQYEAKTVMTPQGMISHGYLFMIDQIVKQLKYQLAQHGLVNEEDIGW
jgi:hypothetical protein